MTSSQCSRCFGWDICEWGLTRVALVTVALDAAERLVAALTASFRAARAVVAVLIVEARTASGRQRARAPQSLP